MAGSEKRFPRVLCCFVYFFEKPFFFTSQHCTLFVGSKNREFSFRHDWNSLISDDPSLQLKHYTEEYFPPADVYVCTQHMDCVMWSSQVVLRLHTIG